MKQWLLREAKTLLNLVPDTENILAIARQHRANFAFLFPSIAVATDKHVIVCNRWFAGLKQDISFIPYGAIVSMRVEHSIFFSTIYLRLHGSASKKDTYLIQKRRRVKSEVCFRQMHCIWQRQ